MTIVYGDFEWDDAKAATNLIKHGISFEEAVTAVIDPNALFLADDSGTEQRLVAIGDVETSARLVRRTGRARPARSHHQRTSRDSCRGDPL